MSTKTNIITLTLITATLSLTGCSKNNALDNKIKNEVNNKNTESNYINGSNDEYSLIQFPQKNVNRYGYNTFTQAVNDAKSSLNLEIYSLNDPILESAIVQAQQRGVKETILINANSGFGHAKFNDKAYAYLKSNKVNVKWAPSGYIFHIKTMLVDNKIAYISTANLNQNNYPTYTDAVIIDKNKNDINAIAKTFEGDFTLTGKPKDHTQTSTNLVWSPGAQGTFANFISSAKKSIRFSSEEVVGKSVVDALANTAKKGVSCEIITPTPIKNTIADELTSAGCKLIVPKSTYVHEKQIIIDSSTVLVGSQNDSVSSLQKNRELSIKLNDKNIINAMTSTFDNLIKN